ncbi:hypothetical protein HFN52_10725 [Rhizobium leguminosarum]|nr:hypothetical protein [Rhizobium leguminosarum]
MPDDILIEDLPLGTPSRNAWVPVSNAGASGRLSVGQMLDLLVDGAPATLDTLNEIAAALNDDANLAATLTAAIALKADASTTTTHALTAKTTPVDADEFRIADSAASFGFKKITWANIKAGIKSFFGATGTAPVYACRAWVRFAGASGTISASGNVTSVTRNGVGDYTVNFTDNMPDANYATALCASGSSGSATDTVNVNATGGQQVSSVRLIAVRASIGAFDPTNVSVAVFR